MGMPITDDLGGITPVAIEDVGTTTGRTARPTQYDAGQTRQQMIVWLAVFAVVFGFGYLSSARRDAIGAFANQVQDVIRDFRGYDPEV